MSEKEKKPGLWEKLHNPDFKPVEFDGFKMDCPVNLGNPNAGFVNEDLPQSERLRKLNQIAIRQVKILAQEYRVEMLDEMQLKERT